MYINFIYIQYTPIYTSCAINNGFPRIFFFLYRVKCSVRNMIVDRRGQLLLLFCIPPKMVLYRSVVIFGRCIYIYNRNNAAAVSLHEWDICFVFLELTNIRLAGGDICCVTPLAAAEFPGASI